MHFLRDVRRWLRSVLPALAVVLPTGAALYAQQHPAEITFAQSKELPYRLSGRLNVTFAGAGYFGTSSYIRRYTGVTAGHMLYDPQGGLATDVYYEPALYVTATTHFNVSYFAVLSGYQTAAGVDPDSNDSFDHDMGFVLFAQPAANDEWATFGADTDALITQDSFLVLGYAGDSFAGDEQAIVNIALPFYQLLAPALYENTSYYTEGGMSGGPLYVSNGGVMQVAAVTVAGTSPPDPAYSDVRAITPSEATLFTEAEYVHGLITSGTIRGPSTVTSGGVAKYKTGVVFADGMAEGKTLARSYDELVLTPVGPGHRKVSVTKLKTSRWALKFSSSLATGDTINLQLLRNTVAKSAQTPLATLTVTVQ